MAGSLRWFRYTADSGVNYAILADESNTELINTNASTTASVSGLTTLPKSIQPRRITVEDGTGRIKRICYALTPTTYAALSNATDFTLSPLNFSGVSEDTIVSPVLKVSEKIRRQPKNKDTGLNDGDDP